MKKLKAGYKITALVLVALLIFAPANYLQATELNDAQQEQQKIEDALSAAKSLVQELETSAAGIEEKIVQLDNQLTGISTQIEQVDDKIKLKKQEIEQKTQELEVAKKTEEVQYEDMKKRIQFMYESSTASMLELVLSSSTIRDFLNRLEYVKEISTYDRKMLTKYQETKEEIAQASERLQEEQENLLALETLLESDQEAVNLLLSKKEVELVQVSTKVDQVSETVDVYEEELAATNEIIEQIKQVEAAKKKAAEEAARKAAEEAAKKEEEQSQSQTQDSETNSEEVKEDSYNGGAFTWPVPSSTRVTSDFGERVSPTSGASTNHKGIDIGAAAGADIVAASAGTVVFAGYSSKAGNYLMVDHGGSLYTVYMHCSSLIAGYGKIVTKGEVIAKVGSTGVSTGNHLHFGVSLNGSYVSPWNYLSR